MLKSFLIASLVIFIFKLSIAQDAYTQSEKINFNRGVYSGCIEKQKQGELNKALKVGITEELCECYANTVTTKVYGNIDFQEALVRRNNFDAKRIIEESMKTENSIANFNLCMGKVEQKYGGKDKLFENKSDVIISNKIGLNGESRASFILSGVSSCANETKDSNAYVIKKYCTCYMNYMADRLSHRDLVDMAKQSERMLRKSSELRKNGISSCEHILN